MDARITGLGQPGELACGDRAPLPTIFSSRRTFGAGDIVLAEGHVPAFAGELLEGLLLRCKFTPGGHRQIVGLLVPGDLVEPQGFLLGAMDHTVVAKIPSVLGTCTPPNLSALADKDSGVRERLMRSALMTAAAHREWVVSCGRRSGPARVAHLFCELGHRTGVEPRSQPVELAFPLSQIDIADAVGLSAVHVNRILRTMRTTTLAHLKGGVLRVPHWDSLRRAADFDPDYLHGASAPTAVASWAACAS